MKLNCCRLEWGWWELGDKSEELVLVCTSEQQKPKRDWCRWKKTHPTLLNSSGNTIKLKETLVSSCRQWSLSNTEMKQMGHSDLQKPFLGVFHIRKGQWALYDTAWTGAQTRWPPEVPSSLTHSVILVINGSWHRDSAVRLSLLLGLAAVTQELVKCMWVSWEQSIIVELAFPICLLCHQKVFPTTSGSICET